MKNTKESLPESVVEILKRSDYDNATSISGLNERNIIELEKFVTEHFIDLIRTDATYSHISKTFHFLPGHKTHLLLLPTVIEKFRKNSMSKQLDKQPIKLNGATFILKEIVESFRKNVSNQPKQRRYSEVLQYFAIYVYMLCGKAGYEIVCKNLPLPQISTISKYLNLEFPS